MVGQFGSNLTIQVQTNGKVNCKCWSLTNYPLSASDSIDCVRSSCASSLGYLRQPDSELHFASLGLTRCNWISWCPAFRFWVVLYKFGIFRSLRLDHRLCWGLSWDIRHSQWLLLKCLWEVIISRNMLKSKGDRMHPWSTPITVSNHSDSSPFTRTALKVSLYYLIFLLSSLDICNVSLLSIAFFSKHCQIC